MSLRQTVGIYQITNKHNLKNYIGSTRRNFHDRFRDHKRDLKKNKHHNKYLQNAWNKYGEESFEFTVLEVIDKSLDKKYFLEKETYWINKFSSFDSIYGYNLVSNPSEHTKPKLKVKTTNKISRPTLKKVFKKPKCIKGWCPVNYYYVENVNTKERILISNIIRFSREHNINPSNLRNTLKGSRYQCNGFKLISLDENKNNHKQAKWLVITPDSKELYINDLKNYCKQNKFNYSSFKQTSYNPKSIQYKGYRCYLLDNIINNIQQYPKCNYTYKVIDPNNNVYLTKSLIELGNKLNINGKYLSHTYRQVKNPLSNWKVIKL